MKLIYISFEGAEKHPFCGENFRSFLVPLSIFLVFFHRVPSFLDDALEHKLVLNKILLIFKYYICKARENKDLNFNVLKNYLTKLRDLEAGLKDNDKYNKKWTVISIML